MHRTSIVGITTLGLSGYDLLRTRKSSNTTLVHRLRTVDRQDSSVQNVTNELDRDFSSNSEEDRKVACKTIVSQLKEEVFGTQPKFVRKR